MSIFVADVRPLDECAFCPRLCHFTCPGAVSDASQDATAWGMMSVIRMLEGRELTANADVAEILMQCTSCGNCTAICRHSVPVASTIIEARTSLAAAGVHGPTVLSLLQQLESGAPTARSERAAEFGRQVQNPAGASVGIWLSCTHNELTGVNWESLRRLAEYLSGQSVSILNLDAVSGVRCCGGAARRAGLRSQHESLRSDARARASGMRLILTDCSEAREIFSCPTKSLIEFLAESKTKLSTCTNTNVEPAPVIFFPGCGPSCSDAERDVALELLKVLSGPVELAFSANGAPDCCGADVIFRTANPDAAAQAAINATQGAVRLELEPEAPMIIASSHRCASHMSAASGGQVLSLLEWTLKRCSIPV